MKKLFFLVLLFNIFVTSIYAQESDLFSHKRINLYDINKMPNSKGTVHKDSIFRNRIWRTEQPRIYEYRPGAEENKGTAVIVIPSRPTRQLV